jgi:hypothetical protein
VICRQSWEIWCYNSWRIFAIIVHISFSYSFTDVF